RSTSLPPASAVTCTVRVTSGATTPLTRSSFGIVRVSTRTTSTRSGSSTRTTAGSGAGSTRLVTSVDVEGAWRRPHATNAGNASASTSRHPGPSGADRRRAKVVTVVLLDEQLRCHARIALVGPGVSGPGVSRHTWPLATWGTLPPVRDWRMPWPGRSASTATMRRATARKVTWPRILRASSGRYGRAGVDRQSRAAARNHRSRDRPTLAAQAELARITRVTSPGELAGSITHEVL